MSFFKTIPVRPGHRRSAGVAAALLLAASSIILSGCQGIVNTATSSQVRVIDASPDAPGIDIYQNNAAVAYNLGFGTVTSYIPVDPGTYTTTATVSGSKQVLSSSKSTFATGGSYTVLIGNVAADLQQLTLKDQSQPAPSGQIALRFIDQATRLSALDVYLVPSGSKLTDANPILTNIVFNTNTGYINVPIGNYAIVLLPTGTVPTSTTTESYTGATITYPSGSARTVILLDQLILNNPGFQVIETDDYDSPTSAG